MASSIMDRDYQEQHRFAMNAGDGSLSYFKNSSYQGGVLEAGEAIMEEEICRNLGVRSSRDAFCIADFGCSTGKNSFQAIHAIVEAVKRKCALKIPEFYVVFNDVVSNDYNTLFASLPPHRSYTAAAVAGDFHRRLLPPSSVHCAYSSWSLHWLTQVPKAAADGNGGEIFYSRERKEVYDAYLDQFERDIESFLNARAVEMVDGGLITLLIPGVPAFWDPQKEFTVASVLEPLRSSLLQLAEKGRLSGAKIESFNIPHFFPTPQQLKAILQRSCSFRIERMEILETGTLLTVQARAACIRVVHQSMLTDHFGAEIIDELFRLYEKKLSTSPVFQKPENDRTVVLLAILKRRSN